MPDNHHDMLNELYDSQGAEEDQREYVEEADLFLNKRDGQWEPSISRQWSNRPRYTFDQCNPVVDAIMAEMEQTDFAIDVKPSGGNSTKETAMTYGGIIRNIENISNARFTYKAAARKMVGTGLAGWRIVQKYRDSDSFDQDLLIESILNFKERVWFDQDTAKQSAEDSKKCWILTSMQHQNYKELWPEGSGRGVSEPRSASAYDHKKSEEIIVGEHYFKETKKRELALMTSGEIFVIDDDFQKVHDEYKERGILVEDTRTRDVVSVKHRFFDGDDYLSNKTDTVFEYIPVIPVYSNFDLCENKVVYWGSIEKLMDPQRVLNYAESKKVAESALKPIEKTWMTTEQAESTEVKTTLATQNVNTDPVQLYDHVEGHVPPYKPQPTQPDMVLIEASQSAQTQMDRASGLFGPNRGQALANQAAETVKLLQNKGDSSNFKYFNSMEVAITHTARILVKAAPLVYSGRREVRLIGEDGTVSTATLKEKVFDEETQTVIELNDLSKGSYDTTCSSGPAFANKQQETVTNMLEIGKILPSVLEQGQDVLLSNISAPGMDAVASRIRQKMVLQGIIPEDQLTDEEIEMLKTKAGEEQKPDPIEEANLKLAEAENKKGDAALLKEKREWAESQAEVELKEAEQEIDAFKAETDRINVMIKAKQAGVSIGKVKAEIVGQKLDNQSKLIDLFTPPKEATNANPAA